MEDKIDAWGVLVGKPKEKRPLGRPRHRRENDVNLLAPEFFF